MNSATITEELHYVFNLPKSGPTLEKIEMPFKGTPDQAQSMAKLLSEKFRRATVHSRFSEKHAYDPNPFACWVCGVRQY